MIFLTAFETNMVPNARTFNLLMQGRSRYGDVPKAEQLLERMTAAGVKPDMWTYNALITVYAKNGDTHKAEQVLEKISRIKEMI